MPREVLASLVITSSYLRSSPGPGIEPPAAINAAPAAAGGFGADLSVLLSRAEVGAADAEGAGNGRIATHDARNKAASTIELWVAAPATMLVVKRRRIFSANAVGKVSRDR